MAETTAYVLLSWLQNQGRCQCGWHGKRRWFRGSAVVDVLNHCGQTGHLPVGLPPAKRLISSF
jgi:hypothetical protein